MNVVVRSICAAVAVLAISVLAAGCSGSDTLDGEDTDSVSAAYLEGGPDCPGDLAKCYDNCGMGPASCYSGCDTVFRKCIGLPETEAVLEN